MKITLSKRIGLLAFLLPCALALSTTVHAETNKLVIESGDMYVSICSWLTTIWLALSLAKNRT